MRRREPEAVRQVWRGSPALGDFVMIIGVTMAGMGPAERRRGMPAGAGIACESN